MFEHYLETAVDILAPPDRVWDILTDFPAYPAWNPFIVSIYGQAVAGTALEVHIRPPGHRAAMFRPTVLAAEPERELRWVGRLLVPGMLQGDHFFRLEERSGTVHLVHGETFSGLLVSLFRRRLKATQAGFEAMNAALKERAERPAG
ncbi:MAG TPA: SRPBCC domain-containing protein [Vineibacter sp.]|nr:SRPBCC domain-containing protein [Vineibacter sp.]